MAWDGIQELITTMEKMTIVEMMVIMMITRMTMIIVVMTAFGFPNLSSVNLLTLVWTVWLAKYLFQMDLTV